MLLTARYAEPVCPPRAADGMGWMGFGNTECSGRDRVSEKRQEGGSATGSRECAVWVHTAFVRGALVARYPWTFVVLPRGSARAVGDGVCLF